MDIDIIELDNGSFSKDILDKTTFFSLAEMGAMGERGRILFVTEDGKVYHTNYLTGDLQHETMLAAFPVMADCHFGMFGTASVPKGWVYVDLGMGNHLIVREDYYEQFSAQSSKYKKPGELYSRWLEIALYVT